MPDFVFAYRNPAGYTPTPETRAAWTAWFDGMGEQLAELGKPAVARTALGNCGPDSTELGGTWSAGAGSRSASSATSPRYRRPSRASALGPCPR